MKRSIIFCLLFALASCANNQSADTVVEYREWLSLTPQELEQSRANIMVEGHPAQQAYAQLIEDAEMSMESPIYTVLDKIQTAPSGDKRDYLSLSPYWWPNPDTEDGLPFVRIDGVTNPIVRGDNTDKLAMELLTRDIYNLGLAYYFSGDERYAQKASEMIRAWFLDEETSMNPNMEYGQGVPGVADGRANALIESRHLIKVIDVALLLQHMESPSFTAQDMAGLRQWFSDLVDWAYVSDVALAENNTYNNHAMWYNAQLVAFLMFIGDEERAAQEIRTALMRERSQFAVDGSQPVFFIFFS